MDTFPHNEVEGLFEQFKNEALGFLLRIQTVRVLDVDAFKRIDLICQKLAQVLKNHPFVPKNVLNEIRACTIVLRAEAPYFVDKQNEMNSMADKLEMTFDLILMGEEHSDRIPGVPRII